MLYQFDLNVIIDYEEERQSSSSIGQLAEMYFDTSQVKYERLINRVKVDLDYEMITGDIPETP